jgi:protease-4
VKRVLAGVALAAIAATGCQGRPKHGGAGGAGDESEPKSGPAIAVLDLSDGLPEIEPTGFLGVPTKRSSFDKFVRAIDPLLKDDDVKGVLVRFGSTAFGVARAAEVGERLDALKRAGRPVHCYADDYTNSSIMAAARGCSKIWVAPAGSVEATGLALETIYFHKLLAEELHLSIDFLQVGKYKGAEEPFTRDGPSPEAGSTMQSMITSLRDGWLDAITKGRVDASARSAGHANVNAEGVAAAAEDGPYSPEGAKDRGLVDAVGFWDDALTAEKKETGAVRDETRFGHGAVAKDDDLGDVIRVLAGSRAASAPIALVRESGSIAMSGGGGPLGGGNDGITEEEMSRVLARVERDDAVKALVVRIDSPGGSALASDLIWHQMKRVRAKKPIVVSVGAMAASGGYYISSAANAIVAEPTSIVGSIGVVTGKVAVGGALSSIGVHTQVFAGNPQAASRASYGSVFDSWDEATRAKMLDTAKSIYELFLSRIEEGRGMTRDKIEPYAEGRLFSGAQAKEYGLVDELGGLTEAIAKARALAGLPADAGVAAFSAKTSFLESLVGGGDDDTAAPVGGPLGGEGAAVESAARAAIEKVEPGLWPFVSSLAGMARGESTACAVPFGVVVR